MTRSILPFSIHRSLAAQAERRPHATALLAPGRQPLSFARLYQQVEGITASLRAMGVKRNDRVAMVLPNGPEMAVAFLGIAAGATCAPLNPAYQSQELHFYLTSLEARAVVVLKGFDTPVRAVAQSRGIPLIELTPCEEAEAGVFQFGEGKNGATVAFDDLAERDDFAFVLHTSGTTGRPKIAALTHGNLLAVAHNLRQALQLTEADRCLNIMPLFHVQGAVVAVLGSLANGGSVVCTPGFYGPRFFEWMDEFCPTWYTAVPSMHRLIVARATENAEVIRRRPLRFVRSSSAVLPPQVMADLEKTFRVPVVEAYGLTEAVASCSTMLPPVPRKPGSVGRASGTEIAIMDEQGCLLAAGTTGEIVIRGPNVTPGYLDSLETNKTSFSHGWLRTGDHGYLDQDGFLFFTGRLKEVINRGGENIAPLEVDQVLLDHPAVADAVTVGVPDILLGEDVAAAVVLRMGLSATPRGLREFVAQRLASFKVPREILIVDDLPKGASGKVQRLAVARHLPFSVASSAPANEPFGYTPPRTSTERQLARIWCEVLGLKAVGVHDRFADLGGDSILAMQLLARIHQSFQTELSLMSFYDDGSTIATMAGLLGSSSSGAGEQSSATILPAPRTGTLPLSFGQQQLWLIDQLQPPNPLYNIYRALQLKGPLDALALQRALDAIVSRHETLRTTFQAVDGKPVLHIAPHRGFDLPVIDLRDRTDAERAIDVERLKREEVRRPFNLSQDVMLRATLLKLVDEEHILLLTMHHVASDGWSLAVLFRELSCVYTAFRQGQPSPLPALPIQYVDYAAWQRESLPGELLAEQLAYWKSQLGDVQTVLELPTDHLRQVVPTNPGATLWRLLPKSLMDSLKALGRQEDVTLFMTLLAGFQTLLHRYSRQDEIRVGTPIANRNHVETEGLIGFFVNTLVMRADLSGDPGFREMLQQVRKTALEAYGHQDLPFDRLVAEIHPERNANYSPLFQVFFALQNTPPALLDLEGISVRRLQVHNGTAMFDLSMFVTEKADGLQCVLEYNTALFNDPTITRMLGQFQTLLESIVQNPDQRVSEFPLLSGVERRQLLVEWNDRRTDNAPYQCIHQFFECQAGKTPAATAATFFDRSLTYAELNARANQLAHHLRSAGVGPEVRVAISMERSLEMVLAVLAVLKAGGAYVPIDPTYPKERVEFMLADSKARVLLTQERLVKKLPLGVPSVTCLDRDWEVIARSATDNLPALTNGDNLAYVIYTSGSAGHPKGVAMPHQPLVNLIWWQCREASFAPQLNTLQFASLSFDVSFQEMFSTWYSGGTLILVPNDMRSDLNAIWDYCRTQRVERLFLPFVALQGLAEVARRQALLPTHLREVITAGEQLQISPTIRELFARLDGCVLHNHYGPSESHVVTKFTLLGPAGDWPALPPIGKPVANARIYLLDARQQPVPIGVHGELYVGGDCLARGYLNRPELTEEKFVADPFSIEAGARLYRTGDLARYLTDGNIQFLGRMDDQVKIRGFRIELGEIENNLRQHPDVRDAVVVAREDGLGQKRLIGYVVSNAAPPPGDHELRAFLKNKLPDYMVPSQFVVRDKFPLTPSGKVDRKALPVPDQASHEASRPWVAPRTTVEQLIATIWAEVLKIDRVGIHDNFFELGGHSLLATMVMSRISATFHTDTTVRALFDAPTVAGLGALVGRDTSESQPVVTRRPITALPRTR